MDSRTIIGRFNDEDRTFPYYVFVLTIESDTMQPIISFMLMVASLSRSYTTDTHYTAPVLQKNNLYVRRVDPSVLTFSLS